MNIFDFDKCIYKYDASLKFYFFCMKNAKPKERIKLFLGFPIQVLYLFLFFFKFLKRGTFKQKFFGFLKNISNIDDLLKLFWIKNRKHIKQFYIEQITEPHVIISASPEFLLEPIVNKLKEEFSTEIHLLATKMDKISGKLLSKNCRGSEKVNRFKEVFEETEINKVYSDSLSDLPIFDLGKEKYLVDKNFVSPIDKPKISMGRKIKQIKKLFRPKHYIKNFLIIIPLFFNGSIFDDLGIFLKCIYGFIALCLACSMVYIINDLKDVEQDKKHYRKRKRPLASGFVTKKEAFACIIILFLLVIPFLWLAVVNTNNLVVNALIFYSYIIVNLLYTLGLKNYPIVDVFLLSYCYIVRILFGALISAVSISGWLYLTVLSASLFMGIGKRRNEIKNSSKDVRIVNKKYNMDFLEKSTSTFTSLTIIFYSLWVVLGTLSPAKLLHYITIPLVIFILMKYNLNIDRSLEGDPIHVLLNDKILIFSSFLYIVIMVLAIYAPPLQIVI